MATVPVSIATDLSYGGTVHNFIPTQYDVWDCTAPMNHAPGASSGKHKLVSTVLHRSQPLVQDGHDDGPMLQHAPMNFFLHVVRSSRKNIYSASRVRVMNRAVACIHDQHQMMVCGDPINLPTGFNVSNAIHTVQVGMTAADQLAGDVAIACSVAIDVAELWAATQGGDTSLLGALGSLFFGGAGLEHGPALKKAAASLITSTITSAGNDWNTPITLKAEIGPAQFTQEIEVSIHPRTGKTHGKAESTLESKREREWGKPL